MLPDYQEHTDGLDLIYLKSDTGTMVPLSAVAKLVSDAGPQSIPHSGQLPSVTISFALKPGISLGEATDEIEEAAKQLFRPPSPAPSRAPPKFSRIPCRTWASC